MESEVNTMTLQEQAKAAYEQDEQERIERARRDTERDNEAAAHWLKELLGNIGIEAEPTGRSITIDGITFRAMFRYYDWDLDMLLPYPCWECGKDVWERIGGLADVHRKLVAAEENPAECEACYRKHQERTEVGHDDTPLEKLGRALAEYINYFNSLDQEA